MRHFRNLELVPSQDWVLGEESLILTSAGIGPNSSYYAKFWNWAGWKSPWSNVRFVSLFCIASQAAILCMLTWE